MIIDRNECTACGGCVPYCPVSAIKLRKKDKEKGIKAHSEIDREQCVECGVCNRVKVCPTDAIREEALSWPRILRKAFSDPMYVHEGTDIPGRGTEEMKTNDVTGRFKDGFVGIGLELGRPGIGTTFHEAEKGIKKLLPLGVKLEPLNPLTQLIENPETGDLKKDVLNERVLSAIVEAIIPIDQCQTVFEAVRELAGDVDTVFSLAVMGKVAPDGSIPFVQAMRSAGLFVSANGKANVGLGRPLFKF
jgi:NAD-dependent dihydropyrimidine dehydrogenase PreA subunit